MKFERIRISGFGGLHGLDTGSRDLGDLVVIIGRNESGKTTLFNFLGTLLYGFQPARAELHPYAPWSGTPMEGEAQIRLADGDRVTVRRKLKSAPWGRITRADSVSDIRNRPVPFAAHVARPVFQKVYALTLDEMIGLEEATWGSIEDRLLASMVSSEVRPAREVADELIAEAGSLWRPNRRGNQRVRDLGDEIRKLTTDRRTAVERDERRRELESELAETEARLAAAREEIRDSRRICGRLEALLPAVRMLARTAELKSQAGPPEDLDAFPRDATEALEHLRSEATAAATRLQDQEALEAEWRARARSFGPSERKLLEHERDISGAVHQARLSVALRTQHEQLDQEIRDLERRIRAESNDLLDRGAEPADYETIRTLPVHDVESRLARYESARKEHRAREEARGSADTDALPVTGLPLTGVLMVVAGVAALAWAAAGGEWTVAASGGAGVAAGMGTWLTARRRQRGARRASAERAVVRAEDAEREAREQVRRALAGLPVRPALLDDTHGGLVTRVERLRELLGTLDDRRERFRRIGVEITATRDRLRALSREVEADLPEDALDGAALLEDRLSAARHAKRDHERAERELGHLATRTDRERQHAELSSQRVQSLEGRIARLGLGSVQRGLDRLRERQDAKAAAVRLQEELDRLHGGADAVRREVRAFESEASLEVDESVLTRTRERVERLSDQAQDLAAGVERLAAECSQLAEGPTAADLDGHIETLRAERAELAQRRDRAVLLANVVLEADRRFRELHQPDVVRRAQDYVRSITDGRYTGLEITPESGGLALTSAGGPTLGLDRPLSRGTKEQVYLALRLAVADHLDAGSETLPLFVDEVLVNWDGQRAARGLSLLERLSRSRQVFVFTCHDAVAGRLAESGAHLVPLHGGDH